VPEGARSRASSACLSESKAWAEIGDDCVDPVTQPNEGSVTIHTEGSPAITLLQLINTRKYCWLTPTLTSCGQA